MASPVQKMPSDAPLWASDPGSTVAPSLSEKQAGWPQGFQPPARWQNNWQRNVWQHVDILHELLVKDWRAGIPPAPWGTGDFSAIGWQNGHFYGTIASTIYRSVDARVWQSAGTIPSTDPNTIASNGSRIVIGRSGAGVSSYSDDDGNSWFLCAGPSNDAFIFYLPASGLWVGADTGMGSAIQSADGITFVVTPVTAGAVYSDRSRNAENVDGSIVLLSDVYSTDQGTSWSAITEPVTMDGYVFSESRGNFVGWNQNGSDVDLYEMSATAGTWEVTAFHTITNVQLEGMFEMRGHLFAILINTGFIAAGPNELWVSRDGGGSWEVACSLGSNDSIFDMHVATATLGENVGIGSGYAAVNIGPVVLSPAYAGSVFAALLAP